MQLGMLRVYLLKPQRYHLIRVVRNSKHNSIAPGANYLIVWDFK